MTEKDTTEKFWKLYQKLPQDLKDAIFAEETGDNISEICKRNEIEEKLGKIVDYVGQVLLGILPPEEFQEVLEKEVKLKKNVAKKVTQEINRFIFFPVKESLAALYKAEVVPPAKPLVAPLPAKPEAIPSESRPSEAAPPEEPSISGEPDVYREPIE